MALVAGSCHFAYHPLWQFDEVNEQKLCVSKRSQCTYIMGTTVLAQPYQSLIIAPQEIIVFLGILQRVHDTTALRRLRIGPGAV